MPGNALQFYGMTPEPQTGRAVFSAWRTAQAMGLPSRPAKPFDLMWQRKQSLYLVLAAVLMALTWATPVVTYLAGPYIHVFRTTGLYDAAGGVVPDVALRVPLQWLSTACAVVLLAVVFMYRNRPRQMRVARGVSMVLLLIIAFTFITDNSIRTYLAGHGEVIGRPGLGYFLPLIALVLDLMAVRAIRADEELVRSADRLR